MSMDQLEFDIDEDSQQKHNVQQVQDDQEHHFHVLAVDDSLIDRKLLERLLRVSSYQVSVTCVDSGDKALRYLGLLDDLDNNIVSSTTSCNSSSHSPSQEGMKVNLIMTDYCMPGMSGYDLLKRVKGSLWKDVPVVIMSSESVPSRINKCLEGGAEEFLLKPLQLSDLEKLQPYILKSLRNNNITSFVEAKVEKENNVTANINNENISISKRKAMSSERRHEMKGLAVV